MLKFYFGNIQFYKNLLKNFKGGGEGLLICINLVIVDLRRKEKKKIKRWYQLDRQVVIMVLIKGYNVI